MIHPEDELIIYRSVNENKARRKFAPATNVQAMMSYEMVMKEDLWDPLHAFVNRLKKAEHKDTGQSLHDRTNIVIILNLDAPYTGM
ncbi:hypothetical protein OAL86_00705 [Verrucomicrobia bacterium]|jgi:hypothetical protein|nr:hypothetical protein [Verrucomicrobiota bacterium]